MSAGRSRRTSSAIGYPSAVSGPVDTSVYVHFPWCARKCPYCDFATRGISPTEIPHVPYADAILRELDERRGKLAGRRLVSIFFGGGTPSLWDPRELGRVLAAIRGAFAIEGDLEVTAECNPSSFDRARAEALREAGVGRISLGVQSLEDEKLKFLGRLHDRAGALAALAEATRVFPRVSGDLMFGMPGQTAESLEAEVAALVETGVEHLSAYALTIESGTPFFELSKKGRLPLASEDETARMFVELARILGRFGMDRYEVSNFARPGAEARHNLHYWRSGAYLGLGAAAVGCLDEGPGSGRRYRNQPDGVRYIDATGADREDSSEALDALTIVREALMLGLRTHVGLDRRAVEARAGIAIETGREREFAAAIAKGDLVDDGSHLTVPRDRWLHLDGIVANLF